MHFTLKNKDRLFYHLFAIGLLYLVFLKPALAFSLHQPFDEACYIEWLSPFLGVSSSMCYSHSHLSGIVGLWFVFGQAAKWIAQLYQENPYTWICALVGFSSFVFYGITVFLIDHFLSTRLREKIQLPRWLPILLLLNIPVLHYAVNDTHLVHAGELVLSFALLALLAQEKWWYALWTGFFLCVTRINDAPALFLILGHFIDRNYVAEKKSFSKVWLFLALVLTALALWLCYDIGFVRGYNQTYFFPLVQTASWHKVGRLFLAKDWGLLWTAPGWLTIFGFSLFIIRKLSWACRGALFWMLVEFLVVAVWRGNGRYFGHRYMIGSYAACVWLFCDFLKSNPLLLKRTQPLMFFTAVWLSYLTWICLTHLWPWPIIDNYDGWGIPFSEGLRPIVSQTKAFFDLGSQSPIPFSLRNWGHSTDVFTKTQVHFIAVCTALIAAFTVVFLGKVFLAARVKVAYLGIAKRLKLRVSAQTFSTVDV